MESQLRDELQRLLAERESLLKELSPLRSEVDDRIAAREGLIEELDILRKEHTRLIGALEKAAAELSTLRADLENAMTEHREKELSTRQVESKDAGLPLLFNHLLPEVAQDWDSYPLESEFHIDERPDAKRVAELVKGLPGVTGCLIVRNRGPVLAGRLPEHLHEFLRAPDRNYHLLFERLPNRVQAYSQAGAQVATFHVRDSYLTVTQSSHAFLVVHHDRPQLCPGLPEKLAAVAAELAKMYP